MKEEILKLISEEEKTIRECERSLENVNHITEERFNRIMTAKGTHESFVEKLKAILKIK